MKRFIFVSFIVFFATQHPFIPPLHADDEEKKEEETAQKDSKAAKARDYIANAVERVRARFHALSQSKKSSKYWENMLRGGFLTDSRRAAARELSKLADPNSIPVLIEALWDRDPIVRMHAAFALGKIGEKASDGIAALERTLQDPHPHVRANAAWAIGKIGKKGSDALPTLIRTLRDSNADVRVKACFAIGKIGKKGSDASHSLVRALQDPDETVRAQAAFSLGEIGEKCPDALAALVRTMRDPDAAVRGNVAWAIGKIGEKTFRDAGLVPVVELAQKPEEMTKKIEEYREAELWIDPREEKILGYGRQETKVYPGFLVTDPETGAGKRVAVKRGEGEKAWERFKRQNAIQGKIRSPHVVQIIGIDGHSNRSILVMDFVEGVTLRELLKHLHEKGGRMKSQNAFYIGLNVAKAIEEATAQNIVHGDIKPENILIRRDGAVFLTDWESSFLTENDRQEHLSFSVEMTRERATAGHAVTPKYQAPEQADPSEAWSTTVDVNQLGKVLFEMLTGEWRIRYAKGSLNKMGISLPRGTSTHDDIMGLVEDIFERSQDYDPDERPTPIEFRERLELILRACASRGQFQDVDEIVKIVLCHPERSQAKRSEGSPQTSLQISEEKEQRISSRHSEAQSGSREGGEESQTESLVKDTPPEADELQTKFLAEASFWESRERAARNDSKEKRPPRPSLETVAQATSPQKNPSRPAIDSQPDAVDEAMREVNETIPDAAAVPKESPKESNDAKHNAKNKGDIAGGQEASGGMFGDDLLMTILIGGSDTDFRASLSTWKQTADWEKLEDLNRLEIQNPDDLKLRARISVVRKIVQSHKSAKPRVESVGRYFPEGASATLPAREGNISPHTLNVEALQALFLTLENAKDQTQAKEIFGKISSLLEWVEPLERKEHLLRQISFLKTPNGALLLAHIQGTPLRTLSSGAHFGVALFIKQTLQSLFGLDRKPMDKFMNEMPAALIDYFLFTGGAALGSLGYDLGVELPFKFYKRLIYRKLVLSSAEARAKILEGFGKSHLNAIRNYTVYSSLLKRQAAFIAALSFMDWWHTGEVDGKRIAISWLSFALAGAVVEAGTDFLIVKIAGHAWKIKNLSGPWGWIATAVELGITLLLAHEIEEEIHDFIETGQRELALQEKSLKLYEMALNENSPADEVISYFNNEYHAEFKAFRDFRLRDLYVANLAYLKEFEEFRREHDLLYKANLEKESLESDVNDAEKNLRSPVAPRESLLSPTFPVLSRAFGHTPPQRDEYTVTDGSRRLARLRFLEIPRLEKDLTWKKTYEKQVQEFEADQEIEFGNAIESLREENFGSPLTQALLNYQESGDVKDYNDYRKKVEFAAKRSWGKGKWLYDTGVSITKIGIAKEIEDARRLTATDNLIQELAYVERIANELRQKLKKIPAFAGMTESRNQILDDFFTTQATILRIELAQMIEFLKDPFEIPISADEEQELETLFDQALAFCQ